MSRPIFDDNQRLKRELEQARKDRDEYKIELYHERVWKRKEEEIRWSINEPQLEIANRELKHRTSGYTGQSINPKYLHELVMDVFKTPSKYIDTLIKLMEQYDSERERDEEKGLKAE